MRVIIMVLIIFVVVGFTLRLTSPTQEKETNIYLAIEKLNKEITETGYCPKIKEVIDESVLKELKKRNK